MMADDVDCATEKGHCPERSALGLLDPGAQGPRALAQGQRVQGVRVRPSVRPILPSAWQPRPTAQRL